MDFVADPMGTPSYYQISMSIADLVIRERELHPLKAIDDIYPKTMITYDRFTMTTSTESALSVFGLARRGLAIVAMPFSTSSALSPDGVQTSAGQGACTVGRHPGWNPQYLRTVITVWSAHCCFPMSDFSTIRQSVPSLNRPGDHVHKGEAGR